VRTGDVAVAELEAPRHRSRRRVERVRVAEDVLPQELEVLAELRVGVQARAGVVEIDLTGRVEARELGVPQLVEHGALLVARMCAPERGLGDHARRRLTSKVVSTARLAVSDAGRRTPQPAAARSTTAHSRRVTSAATGGSSSFSTTESVRSGSIAEMCVSPARRSTTTFATLSWHSACSRL
jgi:hypothetical protein